MIACKGCKARWSRTAGTLTLPLEPVDLMLLGWTVVYLRDEGLDRPGFSAQRVIAWCPRCL